MIIWFRVRAAAAPGVPACRCARRSSRSSSRLNAYLFPMRDEMRFGQVDYRAAGAGRGGLRGPVAALAAWCAEWDWPPRSAGARGVHRVPVAVRAAARRRSPRRSRRWPGRSAPGCCCRATRSPTGRARSSSPGGSAPTRAPPTSRCAASCSGFSCPAQAPGALWAAAVVLAAVVQLRGWPGRLALQGREMESIAVTALLGVLLSPVSWIHHYIAVVVVIGAIPGRRPFPAADRHRGLSTAAYFALTIPGGAGPAE